MEMVCQIVNEEGRPINDYYYKDLNVAEMSMQDLMDNDYNQYFGVRILTLHNPNNQ